MRCGVSSSCEELAARPRAAGRSCRRAVRRPPRPEVVVRRAARSGALAVAVRSETAGLAVRELADHGERTSTDAARSRRRVHGRRAARPAAAGSPRRRGARGTSGSPPPLPLQRGRGGVDRARAPASIQAATPLSSHSASEVAGEAVREVHGRVHEARARPSGAPEATAAARVELRPQAAAQRRGDDSVQTPGRHAARRPSSRRAPSARKPQARRRGAQRARHDHEVARPRARAPQHARPPWPSSVTSTTMAPCDARRGCRPRCCTPPRAARSSRPS